MTAVVGVLPVGQDAVLFQCHSLGQVMALQEMLREERPAGVLEMVPAARTVLVRCDCPAALRRLTELVLASTLPQHAHKTGTSHLLGTQYDGADLTATARLTGLSEEALVAWHAGQDWVAAFGGFAPGFMYLAPAERPLAIPRRATPRTVVPAGSVAVAGEYSAVYPGPTPGGWQLLGRTTAVLWDAARTIPALIQPGDTVRFAPVRDFIRVNASVPILASAMTMATAQRGHDTDDPAQLTHGLQVLAAGPSTTVQDLGRPGFAHVGVTGSGALDRAALRRVNRMVGNSMPDPAAGTAATQTTTTGPSGTAGAPGLETILSGLQLTASGNHVLAVTGGSATLVIAEVAGGERRVPLDAPFLLNHAETLSLRPHPGTAAFRSYVGVRGGLKVQAVLGSCATDVLSGLGPAPLRAGDFLSVGQHAGIVGFPEPAPPAHHSPEITAEAPEGTTAVSVEGVTILRYLLGPRQDWFTQESLDRFEQQEWSVGTQSNRIGLRLDGVPLTRAGTSTSTGTGTSTSTELPSEGMLEGALQVPPSGLPVLFLADHPVTGGYPVLGMVLAQDLGRAAQLAPGAKICFSRSA